MKSNTNKMSSYKILLNNNNDNSILKRGPDLSIGNMGTSEYSTIFTNSNIYNNKNSNIERFSTPLSSTKNMAFHTIDEHTRDKLYLSKANLEYDIYLSSLKKQLIFMRERRKKTQNAVTNLKRKIIELQKEEEKSIKQLENTKKYIKNIINNRKKNKSKPKKSFNLSTKNDTYFKTYNNKSPNYKLKHNSDINLNTWVDSRKRPIIKNQKLGHFNCYSGIYNRDYLLSQKNKYKEKNNFINFNSVNPTIYNRKKVKFNTNKQSNKNINNNINLKESLIQ